MALTFTVFLEKFAHNIFLLSLFIISKFCVIKCYNYVGFRSCISSASVVPGNRWFIALSLQILVFLSLLILLKGWSVLLSTCCHVITLSHTSIKPTTVVVTRKVSSVQQCSSVMSFSFSVIMELGGTEELTEAFDTQTILVSESIVANKIRKM